MKILLVGAGGHARNVVEILAAVGHQLVGYVDPKACAWIEGRRWKQDTDMESLEADVGVALGVGGVTPTELVRRADLLRRFCDRGRAAPALVHPDAVVSKSAILGEGSQVMAGAVLQANSRIGQGVIVNTGAIVEHDASIADGVHVAPAAIVLGAVTLGAFSMIGAGSIVLPGATVPPRTLVKVGTRYPQ